MKIGFYNFLYFLGFASCSACFNPRDNRVAIITFSQNPFFFRENKIKIGKKAGTHIASKASILGGIILIAIGIEIFISR